MLGVQKKSFQNYSLDVANDLSPPSKLLNIKTKKRSIIILFFILERNFLLPQSFKIAPRAFNI